MARRRKKLPPRTKDGKFRKRKGASKRRRARGFFGGLFP